MEFYDGSTDLGPGSYNVYSSTPLGLGVYEGSQWTLTLGPWSPALGSHTITAVYSGDNNFAGGQSSTTLNNVGQQLFIPGVGVNNFGQISGGGGIAIVSGSVGNLDGAAFTVTVDWGDGEDGQADAENFSFAAGETNFNVSHYYLAKTSTGATTTPSGYEDLGFTASETFAIGLTVTSADGRTAATSPDNAPSVTLTDSGPSVYVVETSREPSEEWMEDGGNFRAVANDPGNPAASFSYEWVSGWPEDLVDLGELDTAAIDAATYSGMVSSGQGGVIVTSSDGAATYWAGEGWWRTPSATTEPTATIAETDTNQTVSAGQTATFDINVNWAGSDASTLTVYYQTVDGTSNGTGTVGAVSGTDYQLVSRNGLPLDGMQCLVIGCPQSGGSEQTVAPVTVITFGGNYDGATKTFSVQLLTPASDGPGFVAQTGTGGSATATIVSLSIQITTGSAVGQVVSGLDKNGKSITTTVVVGQQVGLELVLPAGINATEQWTIPGTSGNEPYAIKGYTQSVAQGSVTTFTANDAALAQANVQYYWIASSTLPYPVSCTVSIPGSAPIIVVAFFNVVQPASTLTAVTTSNTPAVNVGSDGENPNTLHFGTFGKGTFGITWTGSVTADATEGGQIEVVQLVNATETALPRGLNKAITAPQVLSSYGNFVLDDYNGERVEQQLRDAAGTLTSGSSVLAVAGNNTAVSIASADMPNVVLGSAYGTETETTQYVAYLMYQPTGGVWVTLQTLTWAWSGTATYSVRSGWSLASACARPRPRA